MKKILKRKTSRWVGGIAAALLILAVILALGGEKGRNAQTLRVETPQKLSASQTDTFTLDVTVSGLGDTLYPAMSASIRHIWSSWGSKRAMYL